MKKNFWSWVPTDRPWALYPLKANSHSACLNISAQPPALPLPSRTRTPPPPPAPSSRSLSYPSESKHRIAKLPTCSTGGWLGGMQVQGWLDSERRGVFHCWAGQHPLSSGAPSDGGAHWQSHILIWLCKCLLQKALRCNPLPCGGKTEQGRKKWKQ